MSRGGWIIGIVLFCAAWAYLVCGIGVIRALLECRREDRSRMVAHPDRVVYHRPDGLTETWVFNQSERDRVGG